MRPPARRKPPGSGLMAWTLAQVARLSPVARLDLINGARAAGFLGHGPTGLSTFKMCLKRLRKKGCVAFDETTVEWTGRALPVGSISDTTRARFFAMQAVTSPPSPSFARRRSIAFSRLATRLLQHCGRRM